MKIPENVIDSAAQAMHALTCCPLDSDSPCDATDAPKEEARAALEAAAPFIAAQALRDAANDVGSLGGFRWLNTRAAELEPTP